MLNAFLMVLHGFEGSEGATLISLKGRSLDGVPGRLGKSQKEGQEDQAIAKQLGVPTSSFTSPWSTWPFF